MRSRSEACRFWEKACRRQIRHMSFYGMRRRRMCHGKTRSDRSGQYEAEEHAKDAQPHQRPDRAHFFPVFDAYFFGPLIVFPFQLFHSGFGVIGAHVDFLLGHVSEDCENECSKLEEDARQCRACRQHAGHNCDWIKIRLPPQLLFFRQKLLPFSHQLSRFVMQPVEFQVFTVVLKHWPSLADGDFRPGWRSVLMSASRPALYGSALLRRRIADESGSTRRQHP